MTDHLPECPPWVVITGNEADCICDRLRACEARVVAFYSAEIETQGAQWEASCRQFYRSGSNDGRALALDAARAAVAALGHVVDCMWSHEEDLPCPHEEALAAIDALRATQ